MKRTKFNLNLSSYRSRKSAKRLKGGRKTSRKSLKRLKRVKRLNKLKGSGRKTRKTIKKKTLKGGSHLEGIVGTPVTVQKKNFSPLTEARNQYTILSQKWVQMMKEQKESGKINSSGLMKEPIIFPHISTLKLGKELGRGAFGIVNLATYKTTTNLEIKVAVKQVNTKTLGDLASKEETNLLSEAMIMAQIGDHKNIVKLLGITTQGFLRLITEYCSEGSLLHYLIRDDRTVDTKLTFAKDICNGMIYLGEYDIVHRDLASRNILIHYDYDKKKKRDIAKIADFGLSLQHQEEDDRTYPIRSTAPECFTTHKFTSKSDVWSYGTVLMEMLNNGGPPFSDITITSTNAWLTDIRSLTKEKIINLSNCHDLDNPNPILCMVLIKCLNLNPNNRPKFDEISIILNKPIITANPNYAMDGLSGVLTEWELGKNLQPSAAAPPSLPSSVIGKEQNFEYIDYAEEITNENLENFFEENTENTENTGKKGVGPDTYNSVDESDYVVPDYVVPGNSEGVEAYVNPPEIYENFVEEEKKEAEAAKAAKAAEEAAEEAAALNIYDEFFKESVGDPTGIVSNNLVHLEL